MEQNLKKMQELLVNEIINQQYDEEDFQSFAYERYPEKDDLDKWNFDDLKLLVQQYQELQKKKTINQDQIYPQQQLQQINQQSQDQNIREDMIEARPIMKQSKLIPKRTSIQIFPKVLTNEQAQLNGLNKEQMQILNKIQEEKCQIQFDKQIIFSEYEKSFQCKKTKQIIEEGVQLSFKVTTKNTKKIIFSNQVFCIETLPFNWKVERTKEDLQTLEKIISIYLPEYIGYIVQNDQKLNYNNHLENALKICYNKLKTRSLDYFLLFLDDNKANELHMQPFSHYTQKEKDNMNFKFQMLSTPSGQLKIEFNKQNFQGYKKLQKFQQQFYLNYKKLEAKFQDSQQIINQEIEKMKNQLKILKDSTQDIFISDQFTDKIPGFNFNFFYDNISSSIQVNNQVNKFISTTIDSISRKLDQTFKFLEYPLNKCSKNEQELKNVYLNQFVPKKKQYLNDKDVQQQLALYGINQESFSDYQYETISSIMSDVLPLKVDVNYEVVQKKKDEFAYLILQVLLEAQNYLQDLFKELNNNCTTNFNQLTETINLSLQTNQKN